MQYHRAIPVVGFLILATMLGTGIYLKKAASKDQSLTAKPRPSLAARLNIQEEPTPPTPVTRARLPSVPKSQTQQRLDELKELALSSPPVFQWGDLTIDRPAHTLSFPAKRLNQQSEIKYALCHDLGKIHESLFATSLPPHDLHVATLFLKGSHSLPRLQVSWPGNGGMTYRDLSNLFTCTEFPNFFQRFPWTYRINAFENELIEAQHEGSLISLAPDGHALLSPPSEPETPIRPRFEVQLNQLPPKSSRVTFHLIFPGQ